VAAAAQGKGKGPENVGYPRFRADLELICTGPTLGPIKRQPTNL